MFKVLRTLTLQAFLTSVETDLRRRSSSVGHFRTSTAGLLRTVLATILAARFCRTSRHCLWPPLQQPTYLLVKHSEALIQKLNRNSLWCGVPEGKPYLKVPFVTFHFPPLSPYFLYWDFYPPIPRSLFPVSPAQQRLVKSDIFNQEHWTTYTIMQFIDFPLITIQLTFKRGTEKNMKRKWLLCRKERNQ